MNKDEMIKEAYTLMVKNNPDEAIKCLIMYDKKIHDLKFKIYKALSILKTEDGTIPDYQIIEDTIEVLDNE